MKKLFSLIIFFVASIHAKGTIIFLEGTCSAGKTSLCREVVARSEQWKMISLDARYREQDLERIAKMFPYEYAAVAKVIAEENIFYAIKRRQILFLEDTLRQDKRRALNAIRAIQKTLDDPANKHEQKEFFSEVKRQVKTEAKQYLDDGFNVIFDGIFVGHDMPEDYHNDLDAKVLIVLAYCPFDEIVRRHIGRNNVGMILSDRHRFFYPIFSGFNDLYDIVDADHATLDTATKTTIKNALDDIENALVAKSPYVQDQGTTFSRGEMSPEEFSEYKDEMLGKFTAETMHIALRNDFHAIIRTDRYTPATCAQMLLEWCVS